jgi:diguanylate cyclase (GGDEF)-like protein
MSNCAPLVTRHPISAAPDRKEDRSMTDSIMFNQALYDACPTGMLAFDDTPRIRWLNSALEQMLGLSGQDLIGKAQNALPQELRALFDETDVLHLALPGNSERWLRRDVRQVVDGRDIPLRLHFYQDISPQVMAKQECDLLRKRVDELTITDELTGLANRRALLQALATQVTRSRRYGNLLSLGAVSIRYPGDSNGRLPDISILNFSQYMRERLRWSDTIGRYEEQLFLLLMPETSEPDALKLLQQLQQECLDGALKELPADAPVPEVRVTASAWQKGDDPQRLIKRVLALLEP